MIGVLASLLLAAATAVPVADIERFLSLVDRMGGRMDTVRDYTCVFTKQERVGGELLPEETIFMKHRGPGVCVYMKWITEPHLGRETVFCEDRYDGQLKVHEGSGIASWFSLSLDPEGSLATRSSRRPVTQAGLYNGVRFIRLGFRRWREQLAKNERPRAFVRVWEESVHGQPSLCAETAPPGGDDSSGERIARSEICLHTSLELPIRVQTWDDHDRLLGTYTYRDLRLNVGLTDRDFDVENEEYGF